MKINSNIFFFNFESLKVTFKRFHKEFLDSISQSSKFDIMDKMEIVIFYAYEQVLKQTAYDIRKLIIQGSDTTKKISI